ncbi:MAG: FG-GAP-like repeat-containing protein [Gemmatimonadales bacterium]|jgi:hypothetical protein
MTLARSIATIITTLALTSSLHAQSDPSLAAAAALVEQQRWSEAARILRAVTEREPENPRAWALLGFALHSDGRYDHALTVHRRAAEFEQTRPTALYNIGAVWARLGDPDSALHWLEQAKATGRIDMTQLAFDPDAATLRTHPRYWALFPTEEEFEDPFVEDVEIIHEWRGEVPGGQFGWIARNIGDVDGDGVNDLTASAPTHGDSAPNAGRIYVYSGRSGRLLWTADGPAGGRLGLGIEAAGDVNGDGVPDVAASAPPAGKAFVYSGRDGSLLRTFEADDADTDNFGRRVADVGDVNDDGYGDLLVGAPGANDGAGRAYVYSGRDGTRLVAWDGEDAGDGFGSAGHGLTRGGETLIVIGAPNAGEADRGRTYVYRELEATPAFVIASDEGGVQLGGMFVSVVGDVDADGAPDVYASDWPHQAKGRSTGRIYVHSGATGDRLYTFTGEAAGDGFGIGPADAGDVNGDGFDDLVIGAWRHGSAAPSGGRIYVYSGRDGSILRKITGKVMGETLGFDATGMGDVNGDGAIDYLVTSAWSAVNGPRSGRMYIIGG